MQQFKVGDWVRDTRQGMKNPIVQLKSNCIALTNPKEYATQYELWYPKEGEYVIRSVECNDFATIEKYKSNIQEARTPAEWGSKIEIIPFLGEIPSFLKDN